MFTSKQILQVLLLLVVSVELGQSRYLSSTQGRLRAQDDTAQVAQPKDKEEKSEAKQEPEIEQKPEKYPIIQACHHRLEVVFGKRSENQFMDWKLYAGLLMWTFVWVKWLIHGYDERNEVYWQRSALVFAVNLLILHALEFTPSIRSGMFLVNVALALQNLFQNYLCFKHLSAKYESPRQPETFPCDTMYLDLSLPFEQIAILFIAQVGVWWFYMTSILGNFNFAHVNYLFWVWAYLAMQITMIFNRGSDSVLGNAFPVHEVYRLMLRADQVKFSLISEDDKLAHQHQDLIRKPKWDIIMRGIMGFICNSILREIMSYTIPLMLMGFSEPMDFVVYCVGVNFICTLDDMAEKEFSVTPLGTAERPSFREGDADY